MANSGKKINYNLRPAKNIERKMIRDVLVRLFPFGIFSKYQYIGFGSKYFIDFSIIHKYLHVNTMISIEGDLTNRKRYLFNRPFDCIDIKFGHSTDVLPKLDLSIKSIVWLDYDEAFSSYMLEDISTLASRLPSGSIICLSYNSQPYILQNLKNEYPNIAEGYYRKKFEEIFGEEHIPGNFDERGWSNKKSFSLFIRNVIISQLATVLSGRNNIETEKEEWLSAKQILYFDYSDGAHMSTLAFVVASENDKDLLNSCKLNELSFFRDKDECYEIKTPNLTSKEIRFLMEKMPNEKALEVDNLIFNENDVVEFQKNYRYYPAFMEIESF